MKAENPHITGNSSPFNYNALTRKVKMVLESFWFFVGLHIFGLCRSKEVEVLSKTVSRFPCCYIINMYVLMTRKKIFIFLKKGVDKSAKV